MLKLHGLTYRSILSLAEEEEPEIWRATLARLCMLSRGSHGICEALRVTFPSKSSYRLCFSRGCLWEVGDQVDEGYRSAAVHATGSEADKAFSSFAHRFPFFSLLFSMRCAPLFLCPFPRALLLIRSLVSHYWVFLLALAGKRVSSVRDFFSQPKQAADPKIQASLLLWLSDSRMWVTSLSSRATAKGSP